MKKLLSLMLCLTLLFAAVPSSALVVADTVPTGQVTVGQSGQSVITSRGGATTTPSAITTTPGAIDLAPGFYSVNLNWKKATASVTPQVVGYAYQAVAQYGNYLFGMMGCYAEVYLDDQGKKRQRLYLRIPEKVGIKVNLDQPSQAVDNSANYNGNAYGDIVFNNASTTGPSIQVKQIKKFVAPVVNQDFLISQNNAGQKIGFCDVYRDYVLEMPACGAFNLSFSQYSPILGMYGLSTNYQWQLKGLKPINHQPLVASDSALAGHEVKLLTSSEKIRYQRAGKTYVGGKNNRFVFSSNLSHTETASNKKPYFKLYYTTDIDLPADKAHLSQWQGGIYGNHLCLVDRADLAYPGSGFVNINDIIKGDHLKFKILRYSELEDRFSDEAVVDLYRAPESKRQADSADGKISLDTGMKHIIPADAKVRYQLSKGAAVASYGEQITGDYFDLTALDLAVVDGNGQSINYLTDSGQATYWNTSAGKWNGYYGITFRDLAELETVYGEVFRVDRSGNLIKLDFITRDCQLNGANLGQLKRLRIHTGYIYKPSYTAVFSYQAGDENDIAAIKTRYRPVYEQSLTRGQKLLPAGIDGRYIFVKRPLYGIDEKMTFSRYPFYYRYNADPTKDHLSIRGFNKPLHFYQNDKTYQLVHSLIEENSINYDLPLADNAYIDKVYLKANDVAAGNYQLYLELTAQSGSYLSDLTLAGQSAKVIQHYLVDGKSYPKRVVFNLATTAPYQTLSYRLDGQDKRATLALQYAKNMRVNLDLEQLAAPQIRTQKGVTEYTNQQTAQLIIECVSPGANLHYTLDGSAPSADSPRYTAPLALTAPDENAKKYQIQAVAIKDGARSAVTQLDIQFRKAGDYAEDTKLPIIKIRPQSNDGQTLDYKVQITAEAGAVIYYTTDGSTPQITDAQLYKGVFAGQVTKGAVQTIKAIAVAAGKNASLSQTQAVQHSEKWYEFIGEGERLPVHVDMINMAQPNMYSMGNKALTHTAWLFKEAGKYKLAIDFQALDMGAVLAYLNKFWYYTDRQIGYTPSDESGHVPAEQVHYFQSTSESDNIKQATIVLTEIDDGKGGLMLDNAAPIKLFTRVAPTEMGSPRAIIGIDYSQAYQVVTGGDLAQDEKLLPPLINVTQNAAKDQFMVKLAQPTSGHTGDEIYYMASEQHDFAPTLQQMVVPANRYQAPFSLTKKKADQIVVVCAVSKKGEQYSVVERRILKFSEEEPVKPEPGDDQPITHKVTAHVKRAHGSGDSMADAAVDRAATVVENKGKYTYHVSFHPIERDFGAGKLKGQLTKLFYYDNGVKTEATDDGDGKWSFTLNRKEERIKIAVWVDAMDAIAGGGPGSGEQDAYLVLDWTNKPDTEKPDNEKPDNEKPDNEKPDNEKPSEDRVVHDVTASIERAYGDGNSMADAAIDRDATVVQQASQYTYHISFSSIEREYNGQKLTGRLTKLFYYDDGDKKPASDDGGGKWSFTLDRKRSRVKIAVWVDAMDAIAGGGPGSGEQDAYLVIDWDNKPTNDKTDNDNSTGPSGKTKGKNLASKDGTADGSKTESYKEVVDKEKLLQQVEALTDVNKTHWASHAIGYVLDKQFFKGTTEETFSPNQPITRAEFVTVLGRIAQIDTTTITESAFGDVAVGQYYFGYVNWAKLNGLVGGVGNGKFDPNRPMTRQEMAVIMLRFITLQKIVPDNVAVSAYNDEAEIADWAKSAVNTLSSYGIVQGTDLGEFNPQAELSRAEVAKILYNLYVKK